MACGYCPNSGDSYTARGALRLAAGACGLVTLLSLRGVGVVMSTKGESPATTGLPEGMRKAQGRDR